MMKYQDKSLAAMEQESIMEKEIISTGNQE